MRTTILHKQILTLHLALLTSVLLFAQNESYKFNVIDSRHGLSNNQVTSICNDEKGFLWFGTMSGLNRYDGYNFKVFKHKTGNANTINDDYVTRLLQGPGNTLWALTPAGWNLYDPHTETFTTNAQRFAAALGTSNETFTDIVKDKQSNFWYLYPGKGIARYTSATKDFRFYDLTGKTGAPDAGSLVAIEADRAGFIWLIYADGVIEKRDLSGELVLRSTRLQLHTRGQSFSYHVFVDSDNDLWIYSRGGAQGIYYYQAARDVLLPISRETGNVRLNNNIVNTIMQDDKGIIWVSTDHGGLNMIDKSNFSVKYITNDENDPESISQNSITAAFKDNKGIVWIGTFKKGINQFHESNRKFTLYRHQPGIAGSLPYNDVNKFVEDAEGNLWIGTNGGGLIYFNRRRNTFKQYLHSSSDVNSLANNVIVSLCLDKENKLWIGTYYGGMDCFNGGKFIHYRHDMQNPESLADDRVWEIFEDSQQQLWVGTLGEGLDLFDRKTNKFIHYKPGNPDNTFRSGYISSLMEDREGNLWIGTAAGVHIRNKHTGLFRHYEHIEGDNTSLSNNNVIEILQDSRGLIWVSTRHGLNLFEPATKTFKSFRVEDGLPDNSVLTLLEDDHRNLWVTTPNGLSNILIRKNTDNGITLLCRNYDETDGLQDRQFNENAALMTKSGELVIGGASGFNIFFPPRIPENRAVRKLMITGLQIFNEPVKIGEKNNGLVVLPESISEVKEISLTYDQNVFTVEFAALDFLNTDKIRYAYKLEGFNNSWLTTDAKNRKATFTNLNPGSYTLLIRASNEDGSWGNDPYSLTIHVLPPVWLTAGAFTCYVLLIATALLLGRKLIIRRAKARFNREQERQEARRVHELDMMKIRFFTNVSHEFRTPLSLIISPLEKLLKTPEGSGTANMIPLIHRNARRLLSLVNQLLDFRKLEEQELRLNKSSGDIVRAIKDISYSFSDIAETKNISFAFHSAEDIILTAFDPDKLERILFNLLSNAFKFTPAGGSVSVMVEPGVAAGDSVLYIRIKDTGIGVGKDKHEKIFERFFQNEIPGSMVNQGSGIGLAITKEFVRLHGGTIAVESEVDKGSCFTVMLPVTPIHIELRPKTDTSDNELPVEKMAEEAPVLHYLPEKNYDHKTKTILLVEDNDDFRFYIKDNLKAYYNIIEAPNGRIGWHQTLALHPDLVVCDISMPEMNGIDLCQKIKNDSRTSFIPVILLTALTGDDHQISGLQTGASDYMTKPFNVEILLFKIRNLLIQQDSFRKTYQKQVQAMPSEIKGQTGDEKFIGQALALIEKNIADPDFSVEQMSCDLFMSRVALYKKILALTGKTPIEFIRSVRMERAARLLKRKDLTVAEIAYEVGFNNPKYFSKYFKMTYQVLPSAYAAQSDKDADTQDNG